MFRTVALCLLSPLLLLSGCDSGPKVATIEVRTKTVLSWFNEPARTRFAEVHSIFMPVSADLSRVELRPGDTVRRGDPVAVIDDQALRLAVRQAETTVRVREREIAINRFDDMEATAKEELTATVIAARDVLSAAAAQVEAEKMRTERAGRELRRVQSLAAADSVSDQALDDASLTAEVAEIELRQQEFTFAAFKTLLAAVSLGPKFIDNWLERKRMEDHLLDNRLAAARVVLERAKHALARSRLPAPIDGVLLDRLHRGGGFVRAGTKLLTIGDPGVMEAVADVLTQDAMGLKKGMAVDLTTRGGLEPVQGQISQIEPQGFTKRSALGVDQQRVKVIISLSNVPPALGAGYRLQAKFITARQKGALSVPRFSVLQDRQGTFYVLKIEGGRMARVNVEVMDGNDLEMVIVSGLKPGERIVESPDTDMRDGDPL